MYDPRRAGWNSALNYPDTYESDVENPLRGVPRASSVGTRIWGGRMQQDDTASAGARHTFEAVIGVPIGYDAVRPIFAQSRNVAGTTAAATITCIAAALPSASDAAINAAAFTPVTFGGAATGTLNPASASIRRSFLVGDWVPIAAVSRTDGGSGGLVTFRYTFPAALVTGLGNGAQSFSNWAAHPSGRTFRVRRKAGDFVSTAQASFSAGSVQIGASFIIVGYQYLARGKVVNVFGVGDSITEGQGTYLMEGWGHPACVSLSSSGIIYEWSNRAWGGTNMTQIRDLTIDLMAQPFITSNDVIFIPNGSPNEVATSITPSHIIASRTKLALALAAVAANGAQPIVWTWAPSNQSVKAYGATDSLRRAYNAEYLAYANSGAIVSDFSTALSGSLDGNNQMQMRVGSTTDNIHPNDVGNAMLVMVAQRAIQRTAYAPAGAFIT